MKKIIKLFATIIVFSLSTTSFAQDMTVFGLVLGEALSIPECQKRGTGPTTYYPHFDKNTCYERKFPNNYNYSRLQNEFIDVYFESQKTPWFLKYGYLDAQIVDGKLERVSIYTNGLETGRDFLNILKEKYGTPTSYEQFTVQNKLGTTFDSFYSEWDLEGIYLHFDPAFGSLDHGAALIETRENHKRRMKLIEEQKNKEMKL